MTVQSTAQPVPTKRIAPRRHVAKDIFARTPYWLLAATLLGAWLLYTILTNADYRLIFNALSSGIGITVYVTLVAYAGAIALGLLVGLLRLSHNRVVQEITSFYVEIIRGVPMLVLLLYIVFVGAPGLVDLVNWGGRLLAGAGLAGAGEALSTFSVRDLDFQLRAILALVIGYSAFLSEVFRAGIESIGKGQHEAAMSVGMNRWQTMRHIVLPQAVRRVLPPLGNNFIAMLKDSALVSFVGVQDITRLGNTYAASTFRYMETLSIVAFLYLAMTIVLSLLVRAMERRIPNT